MGATSIIFISSLVELGKCLTRLVCNKDIYSAVFPAVHYRLNPQSPAYTAQDKREQYS